MSFCGGADRATRYVTHIKCLCAGAVVVLRGTFQTASGYSIKRTVFGRVLQLKSIRLISPNRSSHIPGERALRHQMSTARLDQLKDPLERLTASGGSRLRACRTKPGREAASPAQIPTIGWMDVLWRAWTSVSNDNLFSSRAALLTRYWWPCSLRLAALVSIYGLVLDPVASGKAGKRTVGRAAGPIARNFWPTSS